MPALRSESRSRRSSEATGSHPHHREGPRCRPPFTLVDGVAGPQDNSWVDEVLTALSPEPTPAGALVCPPLGHRPRDRARLWDDVRTPPAPQRRRVHAGPVTLGPARRTRSTSAGPAGPGSRPATAADHLRRAAQPRVVGRVRPGRRAGDGRRSGTCPDWSRRSAVQPRTVPASAPRWPSRSRRWRPPAIAIMSTELLPDEDPAHLTGPDSFAILRLLHADLPVGAGRLTLRLSAEVRAGSTTPIQHNRRSGAPPTGRIVESPTRQGDLTMTTTTGTELRDGTWTVSADTRATFSARNFGIRTVRGTLAMDRGTVTVTGGRPVGSGRGRAERRLGSHRDRPAGRAPARSELLPGRPAPLHRAAGAAVRADRRRLDRAGGAERRRRGDPGDPARAPAAGPRCGHDRDPDHRRVRPDHDAVRAPRLMVGHRIAMEAELRFTRR